MNRQGILADALDTMTERRDDVSESSLIPQGRARRIVGSMRDAARLIFWGYAASGQSPIQLRSEDLIAINTEKAIAIFEVKHNRRERKLAAMRQRASRRVRRLKNQ
jgi:hypothetical protein